MADSKDLASLMESVDTQTKEQTLILRSILLLQTKEALTAQGRWEISRADRDVKPTPAPEPTSQPTPVPPTPESDNTLAGLLSSLSSLFGPVTLSSFGLLSAGAIALAASIGTTIGIIQGQMTAIRVYFKAFFPSLVKAFDDFKLDMSKNLKSVVKGFDAIVNDFKIRAAFIRVAIEETFNDFAKNIKSKFSSGPSSRFSSIIASVNKAIDTLVQPFKVALTTIKALAGPGGEPGKLVSIFKSITGWFGSLGAQIGKIAGIVGKIFAPIAIIMTAFETIKGAMDGYAEGGILGAFEGAITGFFTSLIAAPLDLLKNVVSWVAGALGFEKAAEVLDSFSFTDLFKQMIGSLFDGVSSAINVVKDLFSFGEEDMTLFGTLGKLQDLVFAPVNMAINFVRGLFGFEETEEPFKLQDWIMEQVYSIIDWLGSLFSWDEDEANREVPDSELTPRELNAKRRGGGNAAPPVFQEDYGLNTGLQMRTGTRGFKDFGTGTRATLHGLEAVVPRNTDAGKMLASNFDDNWKLKLSAVENSGMSSSRPIIINAPNNSQTNVSSKGGSASTVINSFGSGRSDLDLLSRPGGAN